VRELSARHPNILPLNRLIWAVRHRKSNGLAAAVYETPVGEFLLHEPKVIEWLLGLDGRRKPRALRRPGRATRSHNATA
jgi:hypothetical protein